MIPGAAPTQQERDLLENLPYAWLAPAADATLIGGVALVALAVLLVAADIATDGALTRRADPARWAPALLAATVLGVGVALHAAASTWSVPREQDVIRFVATQTTQPVASVDGWSVKVSDQEKGARQCEVVVLDRQVGDLQMQCR